MTDERPRRSHKESPSTRSPIHQAQLTEGEMEQLLDSLSPRQYGQGPCGCYGCKTNKDAARFLRSTNTKSTYDVQKSQDAQDVALVASQANTSPDVAIRALKEAGSDLVEAIMLIRDGKVK